MREITLIAHNLRSCHNVGSLLRTAEGLGINQVYLTGYTPYPQHTGDTRLPHISTKISKQIHKTALGAENMIPWQPHTDIATVIKMLKTEGYVVAAIEQDRSAISLKDFVPSAKVALVVGREVEGIEPEILRHCSCVLEIPMFGMKESFNVVQAAAMVMYHCRFS